MQGELFERKPDPIWNPVKTLDAARAAFVAQLREGSTCPCCGRFGKLYKRKLNSGMARCLIEIYRRSSKGICWIHVAREIPYEIRGSDYGFLPSWYLLEEQEGAREDGNPSNGFYRITRDGISFVERRLQVPAHLWFYNDAVVEEKGDGSETIDIVQALGRKFDYRELMGS